MAKPLAGDDLNGQQNMHLWNLVSSTPVSRLLVRLTSTCRAMAQSKACFFLCRAAQSPLAIILKWNSPALRQIKPQSPMRSMCSQSPALEQKELELSPVHQSELRMCIAPVMHQFGLGNAFISTTPKTELPPGDSVAWSGSPDHMRDEQSTRGASTGRRGRSVAFLRELRRKHGLGEFRRRRESSRTGSSRGARISRSTSVNLRRKSVKKRRPQSGKIGLGM